jgi:hypothetical protein
MIVIVHCQALSFAELVRLVGAYEALMVRLALKYGIFLRQDVAYILSRKTTTHTESPLPVSYAASYHVQSLLYQW